MKNKIVITTFLLIAFLQIMANDQQNKNIPNRVEKKDFSNISEVEFFHQHGNIFVQESNNKQVELEIQYFDDKNEQLESDVTVSKNLLSISTKRKARKSNSKARIDYIVSIPRNVDLSIDIKYGNVKMEKYEGKLSANVSYGNLTAQSFGSKTPDIVIKYGSVTIGTAQEISISGMYSRINIDKINKLDGTGKYNDFQIKDVNTLTTSQKADFTKFNLQKVANVNCKLNYSTLNINELLSTLEVSGNYSPIQIETISPKVSSITIKSNYSDVNLSLPPEMSATFDVRLTYGDLVISKKYDVSYEQERELSNITTKKGKIGNKAPTAKIEISSNYSDVRLK